MFQSTRPQNPTQTTLREALLAPLPDQHHLWTPCAYPPLDTLGPQSSLQNLLPNILLSFGFPRELFQDPLEFDPVRLVGDQYQLWHGPTESFKDLGCDTCIRLYRLWFPEKTVVVATSGDTGGAVAAACERHGYRGIVLYPENRISSYQAAQMVGRKHVVAVAVPGDFDRCQALAKEMLATGDYLSCNSISLARILPQVAYYVWLSLRRPGVDVIVPSGNMGNATACLMAKRMGAKLGRLAVATNQNCAVPNFLRTRTFCPTPTKATPATAMDVGRASNFCRLKALIDHDTVGFAAMDNMIIHHVASNRQVCPHTAVGYIAKSGLQWDDAVVVSTAHPRKFLEVRQAPPDMVLLSSTFYHKRWSTIVLVGPPGSGKSTICDRMRGFDQDSLLDLSNVDDDFVATEQDALRQTLARIQANTLSGIVATGGSVIYGGGADRLRASRALVVWLRISYETMQARCGDLKARGVVLPRSTTMDKWFAERQELYAAAADLSIDTEVHDVASVVAILGRLSS